jgi:menaquinone-9 beta-reductase
MKIYDVIIVGAGPAGLICAETLGKAGKSVLLLEKNTIFGLKVCAGGLTRKDLELLDLPDHIFEHKITQTAIFSKKRKSQTNAPEPFIFTVNRVALGTWQKNRLENTSVEILNDSKVTSIGPNKVIVNDTIEFGYRYLVGADGYFSIVRKYLNIPQEKRLIGIQYTIPDPVEEPRLEIHLNASRFSSWYAWKFPHKDSFVVGCCCDPRKVSPKKLKSNFHKWLAEKGIDISNARYESYPISYDHRGFKFGNCFLAGEAAGMASGFTGEGIYQSLVSGKYVAETILDEKHTSQEMDAVLKYNAIQERILNVLIMAGPFRGLIHELIVILMNNKRIKAKINSSFS